MPVTIFDKPLPNTSTDWANFTLVQLIPGSVLGDVAGDSVRLTLQGHPTSPTSIAMMYIGYKGAGDSYDFLSAPVQVKVAGQGAFIIPANGSIVTDDVPFSYNGVSDIVLATSFPNDPAKDDIKTSFGNGAGTSYWMKGNAPADAATLNKAGYQPASNNPNALAIVSKIEVNQPPPPPPPSTYTPFSFLRYDVFSAPRPIELITEVFPLWDYTNYIDRAGLWRRFAHVKLTDVQPGDIIHVDSLLEATNPHGYAIEWVVGIVLTPLASGTAGCENMPSVSSNFEPTHGKSITRFPGFNVTPMTDITDTDGNNVFPGEHHSVMSLSATYVVPAGISGDQYVALIGYAAGSSYTTANADKLVIEPGCGHLNGVHIRKDTN